MDFISILSANCIKKRTNPIPAGTIYFDLSPPYNKSQIMYFPCKPLFFRRFFQIRTPSLFYPSHHLQVWFPLAVSWDFPGSDENSKMKRNEYEIIHYPHINGINIFFNTLDYRTPHMHSELELLWVTEGALQVTCGGRSLCVPTGSLAFLNSGTIHEFRKQGDACTFLCIQCSLKYFRSFYPRLPYLHVEPVLLDEHLTEKEKAKLCRSVYALAKAYFLRQEHFELSCLSKACQLLYRLYSLLPVSLIDEGQALENARQNARLQRLLTFVDKNYMHKIRLSDFAEAEGLSLSYLSRFCKSMLNQPFQSYVNTVRFYAACQEINAGGKRLLDVCLDSGFSDYRYFSAAFREHLGMTPEEYRRQTAPADSPEIHIHQSMHSLERFYSRERCLDLLRQTKALMPSRSN